MMGRCDKCGCRLGRYSTFTTCRKCRSKAKPKPKPVREPRYCVSCGVELSPRARLDTCLKCRPGRKRKLGDLRCKVCDKRLVATARRPYCYDHRTHDPEHKARKDQMFQRIWADVDTAEES